MNEFIENTIDPIHFTIQDVENDNACFYRAVANYIYYAVPHTKVANIKRFYSWGNIKTENSNLGRYSEVQDNIARFVQDKILKYIMKHPEEIIPATGMSIRDSIELIHEISYEEYNIYYSVFAGDIDMEQDLEQEEFYVDRWGSIIEQYVISKIMKCPLVVFNSQRYDTKCNKISNGKIINGKAHPDVRLKLYTIVGQEYLPKLPIFLIWREYHKNGHYLVCYPKNTDKIIDILQNIQ